MTIMQNHFSASQATVLSTGMQPESENAYRHAVLLENAGGQSLTIETMLT